ncbi:MAG: hypothetical protein Ct9H300mP14_13400 [Gammaproteobacteria bacterium]|nr:MAG: hypothetical protein Ct9H300mP14_13400 [Gammaproteobacteria bacterium]
MRMVFVAAGNFDHLSELAVVRVTPSHVAGIDAVLARISAHAGIWPEVCDRLGEKSHQWYCAACRIKRLRILHAVLFVLFDGNWDEL